MLNKKIFFISFLSLMLVACGYRSDENYLVRHPDILKNKIHQCQQMKEEANKNVGCLFALKVFEQAVNFEREFMFSPAKFGQQILKKQTELAKINEQIETKQTSQLIQKRDQLKYELNIMLALVAEAQNM